jgi:hypothetical protein
MRKVLFLLASFILLSALVLSEVVVAKEQADKGPLTKKVFIHYKKPRGKPDNPGKPKPPAEDGGSYTYIASGMKWKTTENYVLNPTYAPAGTFGAIEAGMAAWDDEVAFSIFGNLSENTLAEVDLSDVDNTNVIVFAPLYDSQVIAVTYVWGYYNAPPRFREIVEVDMIFNSDEWLAWGTVEDDGPDVMDILNIATHELGHAAGMGDLYNTSASKETMYGYSSEGETTKRDLYIGDVAGIKNLYK